MSGAPGDAAPAFAAPLERAAVLRLMPQQGAMCLIETILEWDAVRLLARVGEPTAAAHPLRAHGRLGSAIALEFAAQAAAAHGALLGALAMAAGAPSSVLLASARAVRLHGLRLDTAGDAPLLVEVRRLHAEAGGAVYEFTLRAGATGHPLADGRLGLVAT